MLKISKVIVVEGKDDVAAVKRALDCDVITTCGMGFGRKKLMEIKNAQEKCGVIVLTDPDAPGNIIRHKIADFVPEVLHAYIRQEGKPGVEYATAEMIEEAVKKALENEEYVPIDKPEPLTMTDMVELGLAGSDSSGILRDELGKRIGIGQINGKQFLKRLNSFGLSREILEEEIDRIING